jgi:hypothetical protein
MSQQRDPDSPMVLLVGFVGSILLFAVVVALVAIYQQVEQQQLQDKVYNVVPQELSQLQAKQRAQLNGYRHLPGDDGRVALPIERAMALSVDELNALGRAAVIPSVHPDDPTLDPDSLLLRLVGRSADGEATK